MLVFFPLQHNTIIFGFPFLLIRILLKRRHENDCLRVLCPFRVNVKMTQCCVSELNPDPWSDPPWMLFPPSLVTWCLTLFTTRFVRPSKDKDMKGSRLGHEPRKSFNRPIRRRPGPNAAIRETWLWSWLVSHRPFDFQKLYKLSIILEPSAAILWMSGSHSDRR